jgi:hypothetical protein
VYGYLIHLYRHGLSGGDGAFPAYAFGAADVTAHVSRADAGYGVVVWACPNAGAGVEDMLAENHKRSEGTYLVDPVYSYLLRSRIVSNIVDSGQYRDNGDCERFHDADECGADFQSADVETCALLFFFGDKKRCSPHTVVDED